jgi:hypothetical protein
MGHAAFVAGEVRAMMARHVRDYSEPVVLTQTLKRSTIFTCPDGSFHFPRIGNAGERLCGCNLAKYLP